MNKNHKNKFKTPEGYFENFNERLMDKITKEDSIIPKSDGFAIPDGYFESLTEKITDKARDGKAPKIIALHRRRNYYSIAASIAILLAATFFWQQNQNAEDTINFEDLAHTELDAYFQSAEIDFTSYELAEQVNIEHITMLDMTQTDDAVEQELIIEYLDEHLDAIEDLNLDYEEME